MGVANVKKYLHVLKKCVLMEGLAPVEILEALAQLDAAEMELKRGKALFHEGDPVRSAFIVLAGSVQIFRSDSSGKRTLLFLREPGDLMGEVCLFAGIGTLPASAAAAQDGAALVLSGKKLFACGASDDPILRRLFQNLTRSIARKNMLLNKQIYFLTRRTTREKLLAYLNDQAAEQGASEFTIPYDRQSLADFLSVDRSAMSVEIGKLRMSGAIECKGSHFRLLEDT